MKQFLSGNINPIYGNQLQRCRIHRSETNETIGMIIEHSDQMVIEYVIPESTADNLHLSRNDVILSINGVIVHDFLKRDLIRMLRKASHLDLLIDKDAGHFTSDTFC